MSRTAADLRAATHLLSCARDLLALRRPDLAREVMAIALRTGPESPAAHALMGAVLEAEGAVTAALPHWREAHKLAPDSAQARLNLALALLRPGDLAGGLPLYEARMELDTWVPWAARPSIQARRADLLRPGQPVDGKDIVVFTEQGLGDSLMCARFLPVLAARGARVTLACPAEARPVFDGIVRTMSPPPERPWGKLNLAAARCDGFAPLMSLPFILGVTAETLPPPVWFRPDPARVAAWRARFDAAGRPGHRLVGLVAGANPASASAAERGIPAEALAPLGAIPGVDIVNLRPGQFRALRAVIPGAIEGTEATGPLDDFAAALAATDLLVSVDTMAAHMAGAIGHPAFVALPVCPGWPWGIGTVSPWYPGARLFRQTEIDRWDTVVEAMATAVKGRF